MKIKPYKETHMDGVLSMESDEFFNKQDRRIVSGDFGIQIAEDGRVWICFNGVSFIRFQPSGRYKAVGHKLQPGAEEKK